MFKFIDKKKICIFLIAAIALLTAFGTTAVNAFAGVNNHRYGSVCSGVYPVNDTPITVKGMKLVFDISDFPIINNDSGINYRSTVTSEYTLYNPTEETVTANLVIAEPERPDYFSYDFDMTPEISVNGEAAAIRTRHSVNNVFSDEWHTDGFFSPDLPVHIYKIKANVGYAYLKGDIVSDYTKARYIADSSTEFSCRYSSDGDNLFYILGDETAVDFSTLSFYNYSGGNLVKLSDLFELEKTETITLKDLVLKSNRPSDGISDLDWYNGMLAGFSNGESVCTKYDLTVDRLQKYYTYSVEIAPFGELVTSVIQPALPNVWRDAEYSYYYNTVFAGSWNGFGKVEVEINTDYYLDSASTIFQKSPTGFKTVYQMAPHGEIFFILTPQSSGGSYVNADRADALVGAAVWLLYVITLVRSAIFFVGGGISFIVLMVKNSRSKLK